MIVWLESRRAGHDNLTAPYLPDSSCQRKLASLAKLRQDRAMGGWTYILTNKPHGVLYVGVTSDLAARMTQHRCGTGSSFCRGYGLKRLVLVEPHNEILAAISREKALKAWKRQWKVELIERANPSWEDLFEHLAMP